MDYVFKYRILTRSCRSRARSLLFNRLNKLQRNEIRVRARFSKTTILYTKIRQRVYYRVDIINSHQRMKNISVREDVEKLALKSGLRRSRGVRSRCDKLRRL
jgi:hypothetical protein